MDLQSRARLAQEKLRKQKGVGSGSVKRDDPVQAANARARRKFKVSLALLVGVFLWFTGLHIGGLYLFTRGFLLNRMVLDNVSTADSLASIGGNAYDGGWHPRIFDKVVIVVIDALRYDFLTPVEGSSAAYHNAFTLPHELSSAHPENSLLFEFIADPPTTTLQRLKGLTTGSLPTFVDAGSNFAGTAIEEDNLIHQLKSQNKTIAFLGDDTWTSLFPGAFDISHPYDSFNVWDLHTVDNGVKEHLFPLLASANESSWDVLIAHFLGVDHAGHRYGPDHPAMTGKLGEMNDVLARVVKEIADDTLLVVFGDHGMDGRGDHGGDSYDEVSAGLWLYSKEARFAPMSSGRSISQVDLVPTLALALGLPIPYNNLGTPIPEVFLGPVSDYANLATVTSLAAHQVQQYAATYGTDLDLTLAQSFLDLAYKSMDAKEQAECYMQYQKAVLGVCRRMWAQFDTSKMVAGIVVLLGSLVVLAGYVRGTFTRQSGPIVVAATVGSGVGAVVIMLVGRILGLGGLSWGECAVFGSGMGSMMGYVGISVLSMPQLECFSPRNAWGWLAVFLTATHASIFASNSFTVWEDRVVPYLLSTFGFLALLHSFSVSVSGERWLSVYHSIVFMGLTRIDAGIRVCREEQMPHCVSTFYSGQNTTVSSPWALIALGMVALLLPGLIRAFLHQTKSYEGPASMFIGVGLRMGLALVTVYWMLDTADNGEWLGEGVELLGVKLTLAKIILGLAVVAGNVAWAWGQQLCIRVDVRKNAATAASAENKDGVQVAIVGYANVFGSYYLLFLLNAFLAIALVLKPMGGLSFAILLWQLLTLLEILDLNGITESSIGPVVLGLLAHAHFFSTGHQGTLPSIQWDTAFIAVENVVYPISPLLVTLNTYGAFVLTALAVPLLILWKRKPETSGTLRDVGGACATYILYHATVTLSAVIFAGWFRRHLMVWKIFAPRFMMGALGLTVVDLMVALAAVGFGAGSTMSAVAEVFGYRA
ncbi:mannose-ethanolamine phosphotransferase gpi13 [Saitoella coloradoensis]